MKFNILICLSSLLLYHQLIAQSTKPNVLFIVVDDLNDYVEGFGGHPQTITPNFVELQSMGVTFLNGFCNAPGCAPSRTSMLSGKDLQYTQVYTNNDYETKFRENFTAEKNNEEVFTLPEILKDSGGYYTHAINKIFHNDENNDYANAPLDDCDRPRSWNSMQVFNDEDWLNDLLSEYAYNDYPMFEWGAIPDSLEPYLEDTKVADTAIEFINNFADGTANTCGNPFFLAVGFHYPHSARYVPESYFLPYYTDNFFDEPFEYNYNHPADAYPYNGVVLPAQPAEPFADYYALPEDGLAVQFANTATYYVSWEEYLDTLSPLPNIHDTLTLDERKEILNLSIQGSCLLPYLASIRFVDHQMGRVIDALQAHPDIMENTIIIVVSDNGYAMGEKRHWTKWAMWDTDLRIPFIVIHPDAPAGVVSYNAVSLLDIFPTVCNWSSTPLPVFSDGSRYLDGDDFTDILFNPELIIEKPQLSTTKKTVGPGSCYPHYSVRNKRFHYIQYQWNNDGTLLAADCDSILSFKEEELYEVGVRRETDNNEWNNLAFNENYNLIKEYLSQWFPGHKKYGKRAFSVDMIVEDEKCFYNVADTVKADALLYDTAGTLLTAIPEDKHLVWFTQAADDSVFAMENNLILSEIDAVVSGDVSEVFLYLVLYNEDYSEIDGITLKKIIVQSDSAELVSFDTYYDGLQLNIENIQYPSTAVSFTWDFGDGFTYSGATPPAHTYSSEGIYEITFTVTLNDSCVLQSSNQITVPIEEIISTGDIFIYPNPASSILHMVLPADTVPLQIYITDLTGKVLLNESVAEQTQIETIDVQALSDGLYLLHLISGEITSTKKFEVIR